MTDTTILERREVIISNDNFKAYVSFGFEGDPVVRLINLASSEKINLGIPQVPDLISFLQTVEEKIT